MSFFASSFSPSCHLCCIFVLSMSLHSALYLHFHKIPSWVLVLILLISHDIETNPGPQGFLNGNDLSFMNWNLNSLAKDNFSRIRMMETHNSLYNYDIISLCETSLTKDNSSDMLELQGYTYVPANHPDNA